MPLSFYIMKFIHKTVKVVKDQFFTLALAATFIGFSAFKYAERFDAPEDGWYEVTPSTTDPDNPALQSIGNLIPAPPEEDATSCAQFDNEGHKCAIELSFDTSDPNNQPDKPATVQEAENDMLVSIDGEARQPEEE